MFQENSFQTEALSYTSVSLNKISLTVQLSPVQFLVLAMAAKVTPEDRKPGKVPGWLSQSNTHFQIPISPLYV